MRKFLITGSVALHHWYGDRIRTPKDIDVISPVRITSSKPSEFMVETSYNPVFQEILDLNTNDVFIDPDLLLTLKMSHSQWDIKWNKHIADIQFMQREGVKHVHWLYDKLVTHWKTIHGAKKVNLNKAPEEFFNQHVKRTYVHDFLHTVVAYNEQPLHMFIRKDGSEVLPDYSKFILLSEESKLKLALEELLVVAIERYKLSTGSTQSERLIAVSGAYKKLVTSMTSGWFCDYLIESRHTIFSKYSFLDHLNNSLLKLETYHD